MNQFVKILCLSVILFSSSVSMAAGGDSILLGVSFLKFDQESEGPDVGTGEESNTFYDVKLGFAASGLYLGGIYSVAGTETTSSESKRTGLGATLGFHGDVFFLDLSYFFQAEYEAGTVLLGEGKGYAADFGLNFPLSRNFYLGIQMSYKNFTFKNKEVLGVTTTPENKIVSELYPMINLGLMF